MVAPDAQTEFPRDLIPADEFYRAVRSELFKKDDGTISPGAFSNATGTARMSVDWAEKSSPEETFDRWTRWGDDRGVVSITAQLCWDNDQTIEYSPINDQLDEPGNPAHCDVVGSDAPRLRKRIAKGAKLLIPAPDEGQQHS